MKRFTPLALAALIGCAPHQDKPTSATSPHAGHGDDKKGGHEQHGQPQVAAKPSLTVRTEPAAPEAGKPVVLKLMIHDAGGAMLKDFDVVHEQKVHLIIVRDGLDTFAHIHPALDAAGNITASYTFPAGGTYRLFADHQPAGGEPATAIGQLMVAGDIPTAPKLMPDAPGKVKGDGVDSQVAVENAKAGGEATIRFDLTDPAGEPANDIQPYMGAMGHLVVISEDGKEYVHAHPAEGKPAAGNVVAFQAHFPRAGLYKGWGQFRRGGEVRVVPFVVKVE